MICLGSWGKERDVFLTGELDKFQDLDISDGLMRVLSTLPRLRSLALDFSPSLGGERVHRDLSDDTIDRIDTDAPSQATEGNAEETDADLSSYDICDHKGNYQVINPVDDAVDLGEDDLVVVRIDENGAVIWPTPTSPRLPPLFKLSGFQNLTRLSAMNMFGDPSR